jgi:HAD superfamily hydrolase (TIGR01509 family)
MGAMIRLEDLEAAVFDLDDTVLQTVDPERPMDGIHERSRLEAIHDVGRLHEIPALTAVTAEQVWETFVSSPIHSLEAVTWEVLRLAQIVTAEAVDPNHSLLLQIVKRKNELFAPLLREHGKEVPGASKFINGLSRSGLSERLAIASSAFRPDIIVALEVLGLSEHFPEHRIISKESVTHYKPHPESFNRAFALFDLPNTARKNVLAVEDSPRGVASAMQAGLFTCALTTWLDADAFSAPGAQPDLIARSYAELEEVLGLG